MSALPGRDRITQDEARENARDNEHNEPLSVNAPGRDLLGELQAAIERAREAQGRAQGESR